MKKTFFFSALFLMLSLSLKSQEKGLESIIAKGAQLEKLADGFLFTEGPSADAKGRVYFTDQPNDRIMIWSSKSGLSLFLQPSGRSNGLAFDMDGYLWSCADEKNELWKISPDKNIKIIAGSFGGRPFNGPNDLWISPSGGIYFTDPFYSRAWWNHTDMPQEKQCVYYLKPDLKTIVVVADDLLQPNGIVGTPDGNTLYVADIRGNKTWSYRINSDGSLYGKKLFCESGSDGMAIDSKGNLYLTGKGVTIFNKTGVKVGNIAVPESWTANVCFGDKHMKSLFITASKGLYRIKLKVRGTSG